MVSIDTNIEHNTKGMVDTSQVMEPEQNPAMAEPDKPFPFLKLPPELRNRVYELIFTPKTPIFISPELIWYRKYSQIEHCSTHSKLA